MENTTYFNNETILDTNKTSYYVIGDKIPETYNYKLIGYLLLLVLNYIIQVLTVGVPLFLHVWGLLYRIEWGSKLSMVDIIVFAIFQLFMFAESGFLFYYCSKFEFWSPTSLGILSANLVGVWSLIILCLYGLVKIGDLVMNE